MRSTVACLLVLLALAPAARAEEPARTSLSLSRAAVDEGRRLAEVEIARREARIQAEPRKRNWIGRHPSCFGAMIGFAGGFLIGWIPGDDAVFDDFAAPANGVMLGGIGAGAGAILGWVQSRTRKE